jgi:acetyl-CoA C-acetyltransferase
MSRRPVVWILSVLCERGATGLKRAAEVVLQIHGRAGANQVPGARIGIAQCIGGAGATVATHVFASLEP